MLRKIVESRLFAGRHRFVRGAVLLLLSLFFVLSHPSTGQIPPYPYTKTDTIRAIHRLFDYKRTGGRIYTAVGVPVAIGGAAAGFVGSALTAAITLGQTKRSVLPVTLLGGTSPIVPTGVGIGRLIRYNRRREERLIDAYESGEPLPGFIQRKLRPMYFSAYY